MPEGLKYDAHLGDCREILPGMPENSVDAVVCDPQYGLSEHTTADIVECLKSWLAGAEFEKSGGGFMNKKWDAWVPGPDTWSAIFRVLKPGGFLLAFAGTRTSDLMGIAIRLAGFEIRDEFLAWIYGAGFPKSLDVGRAIDMELCKLPGRHFMRKLPPKKERKPDDHVCPETPEGDGHRNEGTGLKPAHEPIVVARKPLAGTVAQNAMKHKTGGINIDGCRVGTADTRCHHNTKGMWNSESADRVHGSECGRWPPNILFTHHPSCRLIGYQNEKGYTINRWKDGMKPFGDGAGHPYEGEKVPDGLREIWDCIEGCPVKELDKQSSGIHGAGHARKAIRSCESTGMFGLPGDGQRFGDTGGASRFFPCFKQETDEWQDQDQNPNEQTDSMSQEKATCGPKSAEDCECNTISSGKKKTDQSRKDIASTTSTETKKTTESKISNRLRTRHTRESTADVNCGKGCGGNPALSAKNSSQSTKKTGICHKRDGRSTDDAEFATSEESLPINADGVPAFKYQAKASKAERDAGCEHLPLRTAGECTDRQDGSAGLTPRAGAGRSGGAHNHHPTLKPINLMRWLVRLVCPRGGVVLDPFAGSFTTAIAAYEEDCSCIVIEKEPDYFEIGKARLAHARRQRKLF